MKQPHVAAVYLAQYLALRAALGLFHLVPTRWAVRLGEMAGGLAFHLRRSRRGVGMDNVRRAFPAWDEKRVRAFVKQVYRNFGRFVVETSCAPRALAGKDLREHVAIRNEAAITKAKAEDRGIVGVTCHMGNWELLAPLLAHLDLHVTTVYRRVKNPWIDRFVRKRREAEGLELVPREGALRSLVRALRRDKRAVLLLADQHERRYGVWTPFFGRPASTAAAPALLALRTGAPIVLWYTRRLPGVFRFEVVLDDPYHVEDTGDREADVRRATRHIARRIEAFVREAPEQWLWLHRRWREPPPEVVAEEAGNAEHASSVG